MFLSMICLKNIVLLNGVIIRFNSFVLEILKVETTF